MSLKNTFGDFTNCLPIFTKYGFKKVSMDEIASETGVTKKTVYSYFSSKEELLKDVIKEELQSIRKIIDNTMKGTVVGIAGFNIIIVFLIFLFILTNSLKGW